MNLWEHNSDWDRTSLLEHCARDCAQVTAHFLLEKPGFARKAPCLWLEDFLDFSGVVVMDQPLAPGQLGLCDLERGWIFFNSEMRWTKKRGRELASLRTSTLAHELGHLRLHRDEDETNTFVSFLGESRLHHSRSFQREMEADLYAGAFLCPVSLLVEHKAVKTVLKYGKSHRFLKSATLWRNIYSAAVSFGVTPTLMKKRWVDLGWVTEESSGKVGVASELSLNFDGDFFS